MNMNMNMNINMNININMNVNINMNILCEACPSTELIIRGPEVLVSADPRSRRSPPPVPWEKMALFDNLFGSLTPPNLEFAPKKKVPRERAPAFPKLLQPLDETHSCIRSGPRVGPRIQFFGSQIIFGNRDICVMLDEVNLDFNFVLGCRGQSQNERGEYGE